MNKPLSKLPYFPFYPADWLKDPDLRRCDHHTKGVWIDMLCIMHQCQPYGVLCTNNMPWSRADIAIAIGGNAPEVLASIDALINKGVCSVRADGSLYCRRMVSDAEIRAKDAQRKANVRSMSAICPPDVRSVSADISEPSSELSSPVPLPPAGGNGERENVPSLPPGPCAGAPAGGSGKAGSSTERPPTLNEALEAGLFIDLPAWKTKSWWQDLEASGWRIRNQPVRKWRVLLDKQKDLWLRDGSPKDPPSFAKKAKPKKDEKPETTVVVKVTKKPEPQPAPMTPEQDAAWKKGMAEMMKKIKEI